jgi:hypothetical protein
MDEQIINKNISNPDVCEDPFKKIDVSTYPKDIRDDITPFLCEIVKGARDESVDPVIRPGFEEFNIDPWVQSLTSLTEVGDPRLSMGELMSKALEKYIPLLDIKLSVLQEGCQVINELLCDGDGKEIYNIKQKCGDNFDPTEEITLDSLKKFTYDIWNQKLEKSTADFVNFIKTTYISKGWTVELVAFSDGNLKKMKYGRGIPLFYVKASLADANTGKTNNKYHKYFFDSREKVALGLNIKLNILEPKVLRQDIDDELLDALSGPTWPDTI